MGFKTSIFSPTNFGKCAGEGKERYDNSIDVNQSQGNSGNSIKELGIKET